MGFQRTSEAQTADYFATPWVVAPLPPQETNPGAPQSSSSVTLSPKTGTGSNLYAQTLAAAAPDAPPVLYVFNLGVDEIGTDNVAASERDRQADLGSFFSTGATITADTARLFGVLSATGVYQHNIVDTGLDQFTAYGYANGQGTLVPGNVFFNVNGSADDLARQGAGIQNPLLQSAQDTHTYTIGGSPYVVSRLGDIGLNVLRYQVGQSWFSNNSGPVEVPGFALGPITSSTYQAAREDFRAPGTILPRLMSDISLGATEDDAGHSISGDFQQASGELINEYEITRAASLIGGGGYEALHDEEVSTVNGQGAIWDIGGRLRPNADSSFLLVYGRHDRNSDFGGELQWRFTPYTGVYASYTDYTSDAQQNLVTSNAASALGPLGAVSGVNYDQNTVIGVLDETALGAGPGGEAATAPLGIPLGISNNSMPLQNGLFRIKQLSASVQSILGDDPVELTTYYVRSDSFTPLLAPSSNSNGANLSWLPALSPRLSGLATIGYSHVSSNGYSTDIYNAAAGATYLLSDSISIVLRYDFIRNETDSGSGSYFQNAVTLGLHKSFS
jgi:uncharacterized protein (PEP-CTERM system associated)